MLYLFCNVYFVKKKTINLSFTTIELYGTFKNESYLFLNIDLQLLVESHYSTCL